MKFIHLAAVALVLAVPESAAFAQVPVPYPVLTSKFLRLQTDDAPYALTTADFNGDGRMDIAAVSLAFNVASIFIAEGDGIFRNYKDRVNYTTGTAPRSIQSADFNGDGKRDIVVANRTSNTVSIFLGNGDGTFAPRTDVAVGPNPEVVVVGDFNADGKGDVAVTNFGSNSVSVLLGNGDGTFGTQTPYATGTGPIGLVAGDISGANGVTDLIAANSVSNTVSVLRGNGDGTFASKVDYPTDVTPYSVTLAQLNHAGALDLAVANQGGLTVSVFFGKASDSLEARTDFSCGGSPSSVTAADFNTDGFVDLVTANSVGSDDFVSLLLGNGDGTFGTPTIIRSGARPQAVISAFVNEDMRPDLVVANRFGRSLSVFFGNVDGTFGTAFSGTDVPNGGPTNVYLADVNLDSKLDALVTHYNSPAISMYLGTGTGTFGTRTDIGAGGTSAGAAIADISADGKPDLLVASWSTIFGDRVTVKIGNGDGTFGSGTVYPTDANPQAIAVGDFDRDGLADFAVACEHYVDVYLGTGGGTFSSVGVGYPINSGGRGIVVQDVLPGPTGGPGVPDILVSEYASGYVGVLRGAGNGAFDPEERYFTGSGVNSPLGLAVGDITSDGLPDVVVANSASSNVGILFNIGQTLSSPTTVATGGAPARVALADMNGDGKLDIVAADSSDYAVCVLLGAGNGTFSNRRDYGAGRHLPGLAVGNLDGNSLPDIVVVTAELNPTVNVLLNRYTISAVQNAPVPPRLLLMPNRPNPFNPSTTINFSLRRAGHARLRVFDIGGRFVRTLIDQDLPEGSNAIGWDGRNRLAVSVASGVYFYQLEADGTKVARRMVLAR